MIDEIARDKLTPQTVLERLRRGNARFVGGRGLQRDYLHEVAAAAGGQFPAAVLLSCIDSRVPVEAIFDQGIGDFFSVRVAGNVISPQGLGSIEFATQVAGAKLLVVMGHTDCGAVRGACAGVEGGYLTALLREIQPSVDAVLAAGEPCSPDDPQLLARVAKHHVRRTIDAIRERSETIATLEHEGALGIVGAMYDVHSGRVDFFDDDASHEDMPR